MGKKIKKDDKGPPDDVFDPLLVESKQAATVVLMLDSPEEDIQAKACEAIYKFVNKCDDNKKVLLNLGTLDKLTKLLKSEEKIIRRNAVMSLGVMSSHGDVKKRIRKMPNFIPALLTMLNPEEYSTSHEFATLGLCYLCQEYNNIAVLLDNSGLEPLVECLKSEDPDVQKNAIECIGLVLQDFEARSLLKDNGGLEAMLQLLTSEYIDIQRLSLEAFIKATLDSSNRKALREMEALHTFIDIIGKPEFNDLHVLALNVLANLLEDTDCLQQIKECGGLVALLAFIADQNPPEEEPKVDKGKKKSAAPKGKKKGDDKDENSSSSSDDESPSKGKDDDKLPSTTLPEVKVQACRAIMRSGKNAVNRKVFHDADTEKMLILLLSHEEESVRVTAAQAIGVLAESTLVQDTIAKLDGFEPLLRLVKSEHKEPKEAATFAIANLTTGNAHNCQEVSSHHGVDHIINCLAVDHDRICTNALTILINMSTEESLRLKVLNRGLVTALAQPIKSTSQQVQCKTGLAIAAYLIESQSRSEFRVQIGLDRLVSFLSSNSADVRRAACWAISILGVDEETAQAFYRCGAVEKLQEINQSQTKRNRFSEVAVERLLGNNLSAKFAILGKLDAADHIGDVFYDPGQLRDYEILKPLESFAHEPVDNRRSILLINLTIREKPVVASNEPGAADAEESSRAQTESMMSQFAATKASKGSKQRQSKKTTSNTPPAMSAMESVTSNSPNLSNDTMNDEPSNGQPAVYEMPDDPDLREWIEEAQQALISVTNFRSRIQIIAKMVSDKMGGKVARDQLMSFGYELAMSELKIKYNNNVIPLGAIRHGIHMHRALLFKLLADRVGISCTLIRGEYNRAWNEIWVPIQKFDNGNGTQSPPVKHFVDLIHQPGELLPANSIAANNYIKF